MTQMSCGYAGDRDEMLIAYLYDDIDAAARAEFDTHLATCDHCRAELQALGGVRSTLARWNPPQLESFAASSRSSVRRSPWWREIPAWAQVAAALLFLGVSAGIANLDIRYDSNGLAIRTGWSAPPSPRAQSTGVTEQIGAASQSTAAQNFSAVSKGDLTALADQLRAEFRSRSTTSAPMAMASTARSAASDDAILRKVRALISETERRQERELALRLAQAMSDVNAARQADLRRVDLSLNRVENNLGVEVLKNKQSMQYLMRVSGQRQ